MSALETKEFITLQGSPEEWDDLTDDSEEFDEDSPNEFEDDENII